MPTNMSRRILKYHKIFRAIIKFIAINMMHNFCFFKWTSNKLFSIKAMFKNVIIRCSIWMNMIFYITVSFNNGLTIALCKRFIGRFFMSNANIFSSLQRHYPKMFTKSRFPLFKASFFGQFFTYHPFAITSLFSNYREFFAMFWGEFFTSLRKITTLTRATFNSIVARPYLKSFITNYAIFDYFIHGNMVTEIEVVVK